MCAERQPLVLTQREEKHVAPSLRIHAIDHALVFPAHLNMQAAQSAEATVRGVL